MEQQLQQISEQQKESWNKFSPGWKKWDSIMMDFMKPMGDEIINSLEPGGQDLVLDIAAGTGEPGLTIATMLTGGKVVVTDIADAMLEVAMENAARRGITNFETVVCDVSELPFVDNTFDAISCRFGFMFFPDMLMAAKEIARVLKPGGKIATAVWNVPTKNFWVTACMGIINKNMQLPPPTPGAPGMFRCAEPGLVADLFKSAGLVDITETEVVGELKVGTTETYWTVMTDVAAPFVSALSKADDAMKSKIEAEVYALINEKYPEGEVMIASSALVISGAKPL